MDTGAWWATVHEVTKMDTIELLTLSRSLFQTQGHLVFLLCYLLSVFLFDFFCLSAYFTISLVIHVKFIFLIDISSS